ncbi:MAG: NCS2 family permease [Pyrinomonadaceae bacterium]
MINENRKAKFGVEFVAGLSTYLTLSYIFILNPILLAGAGINISAAFFATVLSAALATLLMGVWAKVPFAVAAAPSITTFFVSYVCLKLGLSWQAAMAAVILSGILSVAMTWLSVRQNLIDSIPMPLRVGVVFAVSGFLIANGLTQAKLISYSGGLIDASKFNFALLISPNAIVLYTGLLVTLLFRLKWLNFTGAPLLGILAASLTAAIFGIKSTTKAEFSRDMFSAIGSVDFRTLFDVRFVVAMLVFFIIDFFGGVGKYVGLFTAMGQKVEEIDNKGLERSLYVDGFGNIIGGFLGASSLAVFVSSAVGIAAGGRTGLTAIVTAGFMLLSLISIPLVGSIPVEAASGILVFVAFLLIPYDSIFNRENNTNEDVLTKFDILVCFLTALFSFLTYGIDKAILLVFVIYTALIIWNGPKKKDLILIITTTLLFIAVIAQIFL